MVKNTNNNVSALIRHSKVYEIVKTFSDGSELRRYTFYDGSIHSAIIDGDIIIGAVPIEREYDLVAWWETDLEFKEFENGSKTDDI